MKDAAARQLLQYVTATQGPALWCADEQIDAGLLAAASQRAGLLVQTNRCDIAAAATVHGIAATLSDFDTGPHTDLQHVVFRIAKEKALVHYIINRALEWLPVGGKLFLSGYKNEGIKTYLEKAAVRAGGECIIERDSGAFSGVIERRAQLGAPLPDQDYATLRQVQLDTDLTLWSKPGIFGWQKRDAGSSFLIDQLDKVWPTAPRRVLDLGCGYGYLTVLAARRWPLAEFTATDNNIAAVTACAENIRQQTINGNALVADCAATLDEPFDAILCNPPFHQGFDVEDELTMRFLQAARRLLGRGGCALFVVNQFIPLEQKAAGLFKKVDIVARNRSFKLIAVER
ncbi:MAG TPA: methyltransferase [Spongiibacteraceae bacterium]|nr:methyltransferase [Spongiibacteraceae bacterium]